MLAGSLAAAIFDDCRYKSDVRSVMTFRRISPVIARRNAMRAAEADHGHSLTRRIDSLLIISDGLFFIMWPDHSVM